MVLGFKNFLKRVAIVVLTTIATMLLVIQVPSLSTYLAQSLINLYTPENYQVKLSKIYGSFPFEIKIKTVQIVDQQGEWAHLENVAYSWRAIDLLFGNVHFEHMTADHIIIKRLPLPQISETEKHHRFSKTATQLNGAAPWVLRKKLPHVNIDRLHIDLVELPSEVSPNGEQFSLLGEISSGYFGHHGITMFISRPGVPPHEKDLITMVGKIDKDEVIVTAHVDDQLSHLITLPMPQMGLSTSGRMTSKTTSGLTVGLTARESVLIPPLKAAAMSGVVHAKIKLITNRRFDKIYMSCRGNVTEIKTPDTALGDFLKKEVHWKIKLLKDEDGKIRLTQTNFRTGRGVFSMGSFVYDPATTQLKGGIKIALPYVQQLWNGNDQYLSGDGNLHFALDSLLSQGAIHVDLTTSGFLLGRSPVDHFGGSVHFVWGTHESESTNANGGEKNIKKIPEKQINQKKINEEKSISNLAFSFKQKDFESLIKADISHENSGILSLKNVHISGPGTIVRGQINLDLLNFSCSANLAGSVSNLAPYGAMIGKPLQGKMTFSSQTDLANKLTMSIDIQDFQYTMMTAKNLSLQAQWDQQRWDQFILGHLSIVGKDFFFQTADFDKLTATYKWQPLQDKAQFSIQGFSKKKTLICDGTLNFKALSDFSLTIEHLKWQEGGQPFLISPRSIQVFTNASGFQISDMRLLMKDGHLSVRNFSYGTQIGGEISLQTIPLNLVFFFLPRHHITGQLSGNLKLSGTPDNPDVSMNMHGNIRDLSTKFSKKAKAVKVVGFQGQIHQHDNILRYQAQVTSGSLLMAKAGGVVKTKGFPAGTDLIDGDLKIKGNISALNQFFLSNDRLGGNINADLKVSGTVAQPDVQGKMTLKNGVYEDSEYGTNLQQVGIQGTVSASQIRLTHCQGKDPLQGTVTCSGGLGFRKIWEPDFNLDVDFKNFMIANSDLVTAKADGKLRLIIDSLGFLAISGRIDVLSAEYFLQESDAKARIMKVREDPHILAQHLNRSPLHIAGRDLGSIVLDIHMHFLEKFSIRGYGIVGQWMGDLNFFGNIEKIKIKGMLALQQGEMEIANKRLKLIEGRFSFDGSKERDPQILLVASKEISSYTTFLRVEGYASDPLITFSAIPGLSPEEVVALILFGKRLQGVTSAQSIQLALAMSSLKDARGLSFNDKIGKVFGFDNISIAQDDVTNTDPELSSGYKVRLGKQLNDRIYLDFHQSVNGGKGTGATVEVDMTKNTKIEINVGTGDRSNSISYNWEKKY